jgi:hypothetical protein
MDAAQLSGRSKLWAALYTTARVRIKSEQVVDSSLYLVYNCAALVFQEIR